jgi:hypothetical protein
MSVYLDVTFVSQLSFGGSGAISSYGPAGQRDPTGCWYAGACMVSYFFEAGPRLGVPSLYSLRNSGHFGHNVLTVPEVAILAQNEKLEPVPGAAGAFSSEALEEMLRKSGPLWFAWTKTNSAGQTYGHVSVVIGVNGSQVCFHDPEDGSKSEMSVDRFNSLRFRQFLGDSSMLRRAGSRAAIAGQVLAKVRASL